MTPVFRGKQLRVHSYCGNSLKLRPKSTPLLLLYTTARGPLWRWRNNGGTWT